MTTISKNKTWYSIKAKKGTNRAEILIYDEIGMFGVSAEAFKKEVDALDVATIDVRLNTPGGSVWDGVAIYNSLVSHKAKIITWVDSLAASAGSLIAMAGDVRMIAENAFLMIHEPWTVAVGNSGEFRSVANRLDKLTTSYVKTYAGASGLHNQQVLTMMEAETWLDAEEAVKLGFADEEFNIAGEDKNFTTSGRYDLSKYKNVPQGLIPSGEPDIISKERRAMEVALRGAGASRREATVIVAAGMKALQRDADSELIMREASEMAEHEELVKGVDNLINILTK
jgi:ATP-dependent protease ClpP protease subunit